MVVMIIIIVFSFVFFSLLLGIEFSCNLLKFTGCTLTLTYKKHTFFFSFV